MSGAVAAQARAMPDGWAMAAKGVWIHENGARVEHTGRSAEYRYLARDCDGVWCYCESRHAAFAWASGAVT